MSPGHWRCTRCGGDVRESGLISVHNVNRELGPVGSHPIAPTSDLNVATQTDEYRVRTDPDVATRQEAWDARVERAQWEADRPMNIGFGVYHRHCDPYPDGTAYTFPPPDALAGWVSWVLHLNGKTWFGRADMVHMLQFWWTHKDERPPEI